MEASDSPNRPKPQIVGPDGQPIPPFLVPHWETFSAIYSGIDGTYRSRTWDEALRHSRQNSLAMKRDTWLLARLEERQLACAQLKWSLQGENSDDPAQKELATALTKQIERIPDLEGLLMANLEAIWYGRAGAELSWMWEDRQIKELNVVEWFPVNGDKWIFDRNNVPGVLIHSGSSFPGALIKQTDQGRALMLHTPYWRERYTLNFHTKIDADFWEGELAAQRYGVGIRSGCYWYWWLMSEVFSWILDFTEKVGLGVTVFYFDASNPQAKTLAMAAAKTQSRNTAIVMPRFSGGEKAPDAIERIEVPTNGAQFLISIVKEYFQEAIREYINGQSLSSKASPGGGALGNSQSVAGFQQETKAQKTRSDAKRLAGCMTRDLVRPMQKWTHPDTFNKYEMRWVFAIDEPDAEKALNAAKVIFEMGGELDEAELMGRANLSVPKEGAKTLSKAQMDQQTAQLQAQQQAQQAGVQAGQQAAAGGAPPGQDGAQTAQPGGDIAGLASMLSAGQNGNGNGHLPPQAPPPSGGGTQPPEPAPAAPAPQANGTPAPANRISPDQFPSDAEIQGHRNKAQRDRVYADQAPHKDQQESIMFAKDQRGGVDKDLWNEILAIMPKEKPGKLPATLGTIDDGIKVIVVDGDEVKRDHDMDFVEAGNDLELGQRGKDSYIPEKTIWLDDRIDPEDWRFNCYHEAAERRKMAGGATYDQAHAHANKCEHELREMCKDGSPTQYARDIATEPRDAHGRWSTHEHFLPVQSDLDRERAINHYHPRMHDMPEGQLGHVWGHLLRKVGPDEFRTETERGHLQGPANVILDHVARMWKGQKPDLGRIQGAMARAENWQDPDIMEEHDRAAREASAFAQLPHGAEVVSLHPSTFGRVGEVYKVAEALPSGQTILRNRVRLAGSPEWASSHVEPLEEQQSWRRVPGAPAQQLESEDLFKAMETGPVTRDPSTQGKTLKVDAPPKGGMAKPMGQQETAAMFAPQFASRKEEQPSLFMREVGSLLVELDSPEALEEIKQLCSENGVRLEDELGAMMELRHKLTTS